MSGVVPNLQNSARMREKAAAMRAKSEPRGMCECCHKRKIPFPRQRYCSKECNLRTKYDRLNEHRRPYQPKFSYAELCAFRSQTVKAYWAQWRLNKQANAETSQQSA